MKFADIWAGGLAKCHVMRGTLSENVHDVYTFHIGPDISGCGVLEKTRGWLCRHLDTLEDFFARSRELIHLLVEPSEL